MKKNAGGQVAKPLPVVLLLLLVTGVIVGVAVGFISYVKLAIHRERTVSLTEQAESTAGLVTQTIGKYSEYADVCAHVVGDELQEGENLWEYLHSFEDRLYLFGANMLLIDDKCTWYSCNETTGRVTSMEEYTSGTADKLCYIGQSAGSEDPSLIFRVRLTNPVNVLVDGQTVCISFLSVTYDLASLEEQISLSFPFEANKFIVDQDGLMLYKEFNYGILFRGTNLFTKYEAVSFLYDETGESQLEKIKNGEIAVGEFAIGSTHYFICTAPIDLNGWCISFVFQSSQLSTGAYITSVSLFVISLCLITFLVLVCAGIFFRRTVTAGKRLEDEKKANAFLEEAAKAKGAFLSNMSHDIRTPINGILGMVTIARKEENPSKTNECLNKISGAANHLLSLVNDVLDMSRIENGKATLALKSAGIADICNTCEEIILGQMTGRQLLYSSDFAGIRPGPYLVDALKLRQILLNILSNAVKYTRDGGSITFTASEISSSDNIDTLRFTIQDTGIGMKEDYLAHIFEAFSQEESGSRTTYKGTGLGMSITKNYVELMGGSIKVSSVYEKGSTFTVEIPFERVEPEEAREEISSEEEPDASASIADVRILLAEDNELNTLIATELLEGEGAVVTCVSNGQEALEKFTAEKAGSFDIILMDIKMPVMDGQEAAAEIRACGKADAQTIPIIAMTANTSEDDIQDYLNKGMDDHLPKPMDMNRVIKTISHYMREGRKVQ